MCTDKALLTTKAHTPMSNGYLPQSTLDQQPRADARELLPGGARGGHLLEPLAHDHLAKTAQTKLLRNEAVELGEQRLLGQRGARRRRGRGRLKGPEVEAAGELHTLPGPPLSQRDNNLSLGAPSVGPFSL